MLNHLVALTTYEPQILPTIITLIFVDMMHAPSLLGQRYPAVLTLQWLTFFAVAAIGGYASLPHGVCFPRLSTTRIPTPRGSLILPALIECARLRAVDFLRRQATQRRHHPRPTCLNTRPQSWQVISLVGSLRLLISARFKRCGSDVNRIVRIWRRREGTHIWPSLRRISHRILGASHILTHLGQAPIFPARGA